MIKNTLIRENDGVKKVRNNIKFNAGPFVWRKKMHYGKIVETPPENQYGCKIEILKPEKYYPNGKI